MKNGIGKREGSGRMTSGEFTSCRHSYGMSQKEWAEAVGISPALVKKIETGKQGCSAKTAEKVWGFMGSVGAAYRTGGMNGLEEHVLYDILLEHMGKLDGKDAAGYAARCVRPLLRSLSKASECSSPDAQKKYFDFLEMFLSAMHMAASEFVGMANDGKPVPDIRMELIGFIDKKVRKMKREEDMPASGNMDGDGQYSLFL